MYYIIFNVYLEESYITSILCFVQKLTVI